MSLFKSRELWSTVSCGKDESFDSGCMVAADILSRGFDCIIVGSHGGLLRIFQPNPDSESDAIGYQPTDLLIETQLPLPVIQVAVGRLTSGTQSLQIGVLHPHSVAVFSLVATSGSTQHGDQYQLLLTYEHQLSKSAYSFLVGPFGGVKGRDFICILSLDGTLSFFEQETFSVSRNLPCFLLPSPFVYVPSSDSFVVHNANWTLECYRYEVLADPNRKLVPWWTLNVGEPLVDMQVVTTQGSKAAILLLGERNLYCLREGGGVDLVKRLQYTPSCLHPYVTAVWCLEPDRSLMMLVVADTATLLIYDLVNLCWSSQLPFVPVVILRVNLKCTQGLIALLSEEGQVMCCYLGTEPAVFMAPPLSNKALSYGELQNKLATLQQEIDVASQSATMQLGEGHELHIVTRTLALTDQDRCQLVIKLTPSTALNNVQLTITVIPPLLAVPATHHIPSLCEAVEVCSLVMFMSTHATPSLSVDGHIVAAYFSRSSSPRVLQVTAVLPITMVLLPAAPSKDAEHKITLALSQNAVPLDQLFPELTGEAWETAGCSENAMALAHRCVLEEPTTVVMSKSSPRYRIQGDNMAAICLVVTQLIARVEGYFASRHKTVTVSYPGANLPLTPVLTTVDRHTELRSQIMSLRENLGQQTTQYRAIQRRLLSKLRERTVQPLIGLDKLLADTYQVIVETSQTIENAQLALDVCSCELGCLVRLMLTLARLCETTSIKDWTDLAAAMSYTHHSSENQGWEEVCERGVNYLLSTSLAKSVRDHQRTAVDPLKDSARFKKHITVALDRVMAGTAVRMKEDQRGVSPIMEGEEETSSVHQLHNNPTDENQSTLNLQTARKATHSFSDAQITGESSKETNGEEDKILWL